VNSSTQKPTKPLKIQLYYGLKPDGTIAVETAEALAVWLLDENSLT
jgi:hypothetical protein